MFGVFNKLFKIEDNWVVLFDLFSKNGNGDSIRPVAEELRRRRPDLKFFFCDKKKNRLKHIDMADEIITEKTLKFNYVCSKAKYIISPMGFPNKGKKRKGQIFVQTWHGSPYKKIYLSRSKKSKKFNRYVKQFRGTDYFCVQCAKSIEYLKEGLSLNENVFVKAGIPRNDILFSMTDEFRLNLKQKLGLPLDKKVILYCPTWRRYDYKAELPFDLDKMKSEIGEEYILLLRSHAGKHTWVDKNNRPINVFDNIFSFNGGAYPEITHLYAITDIMVSDYSSAIFDFAITQKPQLFYAYDLEEYEAKFGLYEKYDVFCPGPISRTQEELVSDIKNIDLVSQKYAEKYKAFQQKYLEYEKGNATKTLVDLFLGE